MHRYTQGSVRVTRVTMHTLSYKDNQAAPLMHASTVDAVQRKCPYNLTHQYASHNFNIKRTKQMYYSIYIYICIIVWLIFIVCVFLDVHAYVRTCIHMHVWVRIWAFCMTLSLEPSNPEHIFWLCNSVHSVSPNEERIYVVIRCSEHLYVMHTCKSCVPSIICRRASLTGHITVSSTIRSDVNAQGSAINVHRAYKSLYILLSFMMNDLT